MTLSPELTELCGKLRAQAQQASKASKMLADAKTARQTDGGYYNGAEPEQTLEWSAASAIETLVVRVEALEWFGQQRALELYFHTPVYCDDDDQAREWRVDKVSGPINDREWDTIGRGETPIAAIAAARATLKEPS